MRIAIFGNHPETIHQAIKRAGHELVLVVVVDNYSFLKDVKRTGIFKSVLRFILVQLSPFVSTRWTPNHLNTVRYCKANKIQVFPHRLINNERFIFNLYRLKIDLLINVGCPTKLVPGVLSAAKLAVNIHAGKLPEYRGSHTLTWAILNGEDSFTLTAHKMAEQIDAGDILLEWNFNIRFDKDFTRDALRWHYSMAMELIYSYANGTLLPGARTQPTEGAMWWATPTAKDFEITSDDNIEMRRRKRFAAEFYGL